MDLAKHIVALNTNLRKLHIKLNHSKSIHTFWFLVTGENWSTQGKPSQSRGENQQTHSLEERIKPGPHWWRSSERSHHCSNPGPLLCNTGYTGKHKTRTGEPKLMNKSTIHTVSIFPYWAAKSRGDSSRLLRIQGSAWFCINQ